MVSNTFAYGSDPAALVHAKTSVDQYSCATQFNSHSLSDCHTSASATYDGHTNAYSTPYFNGDSNRHERSFAHSHCDANAGA